MFSLPRWRRCRASCFLIVVPFALTAMPLYAASNGAALTLDAATKIAAGRAPQVQAQLLRAQAAQDTVVQAGRWPDPELTAGINNLTATGPQAFDAAADSMTTRSVGLTQEIPSGARLAAEKAVAKAGAELADVTGVKLRLAVQRAAAGAWIALWAAERERKLISDLQQQSNLAVTIAKARLAGGTGIATDVLAAQAAAVELDNQIDAANANVEVARAALQRWIGHRAQADLAQAPDFSTLPVPAGKLKHDVDAQGPLLGWDAREAEAQGELDLARAGKHPNWSVSLQYGERIGRPDMVGIVVGLSLPIFPGNRQDQNIDARAAEHAAVLADHEDARREQRRVIAADLAEWHSASERVRRDRDQLLPLAADRSRTALAGYRGGGSFQPWLDAERDEIATRLAYAKELAAWGQAWTELAFLIPNNRTAPMNTAGEDQP